MGPTAHKCLDELEGVDWGPPTFDSCLVTTCHGLRKKPLNQFTAEDLRIMLGQQISPQYLVPLAIDVLESDPIAGDHMYPGALLQNVLKQNVGFWQAHPDLYYRLSAIITEIEILAETIREEILPAAQAFRTMKP